MLVHVAAPNTDPWVPAPEGATTVSRRASDGGQQRAAIIDSLDLVARPGTAAPRCGPTLDRRSCRARARDGVEPVRMATPGSTASPSSSRIVLAHEWSEAMTGCATVLTRPASSVRPRTTRSSSLPVARAVTRAGLRVRGCRGADRARREGRVGPHLARRRLVFPSPRPLARVMATPRSGHRRKILSADAGAAARSPTITPAQGYPMARIPSPCTLLHPSPHGPQGEGSRYRSAHDGDGGWGWSVRPGL